MNANRIWILACTMLVGGILGGGWMLGVAPLLTEAAMSDTAQAAAEQQNAAYVAELAALERDFAELDERRAELTAARLVVPAQTDDAAFIRALGEIQSNSGAVITSFTVSDPKAYLPIVGEVPAEPVPADSTATTDAATGDASAAPATTDAATGDASAAPATTTADTTPAALSTPAVPGAELVTTDSFTAIPYSVSVSGTLEQTQSFVAALQKGSRLFLVTALSLQFDDSTGSFTNDISGYLWVYRPSAGGQTDTTAPTADVVSN